MKVLVIGGNRYFGKRLVENLIKDRHDVTVLNRGHQPLMPNTKHIQCDRSNVEDLQNKAQDKTWDIIFDQVCMTAADSIGINQVLIPKTPRYIMVSSQSVYEQKDSLKESDYDPFDYQFTTHAKPMEDYSEAKRQAEAILMQHKSSCLVSAVRLPFVLGLDDYTGRLNWHVERILKSEPIYFPNVDAHLSFIHSADAATCIQKLGLSDIMGPINFASSSPVKLLDIVHKIEMLTGQKALLSEKEDEKAWSPYGVKNDWYMSVVKAQTNGIICQPAWSWLDPLLVEVVNRLGK